MSEEDDLRRGLRTLTGDPPPIGPLTAGAIGRARVYRARHWAAVVATTLAVAAGGVMATVAWRGGQASPPAVPPATVSSTASAAPATGPATPAVGAAYPYQLLVHCGVQYAKFGDRWWIAMPQQSRPPVPPGQDGNYVSSTMTLVRADLAHFQSTDPPLDVDFRPASAAPELCD